MLYDKPIAILVKEMHLNKNLNIVIKIYISSGESHIILVSILYYTYKTYRITHKIL